MQAPREPLGRADIVPDERARRENRPIPTASNPGSKVGLFHMHGESDRVETAHKVEARTPDREGARKVSAIGGELRGLGHERTTASKHRPPQPVGANHPSAPDLVRLLEEAYDRAHNANIWRLLELSAHSLNGTFGHNAVVVDKENHFSVSPRRALIAGR